MADELVIKALFSLFHPKTGRNDAFLHPYYNFFCYICIHNKSYAIHIYI